MAKAGDFYVGSQLFCGVAEHAGAPLPPVGLGMVDLKFVVLDLLQVLFW